MVACAVCGEENPARARFCLRCGTPIAAAAEPETRKVMTVVFSDLAGSTSLGERLDPESLGRVMARWFEAMRGVRAAAELRRGLEGLNPGLAPDWA